MDYLARLWLVRHAPVTGSRGVIYDADAPADTRDTSAIAALQQRLPTPASVFASPARRTLDTARALNLDAAVEPALREQNFGLWTGRRHDDLERELGDAYKAFWRSPALNAPPQGESFADQIIRVRAFVETMPSGDSVIVAHSGTIRAALAIALDLTPDNALRFVIDHLSLTRIDRLANGWRVLSVNKS